MLFDIKNMSFAYGEKEVLHNLSFSLEKGLFHGLVGPNGSGKTTLIDLLLANIAPSSGAVEFKEKEVSSYRRGPLAQEIALVPQEFIINFDFTVFEVVLMGRHPYIPRFANPSSTDIDIVNDVITILGIEQLKDRYITQLSGGEKQRVVVARALAQSTPILLLDEATSSLDIQHSIQIFKVLKDKVKRLQTTVVAAIHDLNFAAAYCDSIILLNHGHIITMGSPEKVLTPEYLSDIFNIQSKNYFDSFSKVHQISYQY